MYTGYKYLFIAAIILLLGLLPQKQETGQTVTVSLVSTAYAANKPPPPPRIKKPRAETKAPAQKPSFKKKSLKKEVIKKNSSSQKRSLRPNKAPESKLRRSFSNAHGEITSAKIENRRLMRDPNVTHPPQKRGIQGIKLKLSKPEDFIRVYGGESKLNGKWLLRERDIRGLTPNQIQNKYALPSTPTHFVRVTAPEGTTISMSTAAGKRNDKFGRLEGGGIQYELISPVKFPPKGERLPPVFG
nr:hypothetical protein [Nitrosomonas nitrosa]